MAMDIRDLLKLRIGGAADTWALSSIAAGIMCGNPAVASAVSHYAPWLLSSNGDVAAALGAAGGAWFSHRIKTVLDKSGLLKSELALNSAPPPFNLPTHGESGGLLMGYTVDKGDPLILPWEDVMRHMQIIGMSGVGKTVLGRLLMFQQILNGGGLMFIDGKLMREELEGIHAMCKIAGREQDLQVLNPGNPAMSNTYNPILDGDSDEVSARVLSLTPSTETSAGADYYKQSGNQGVATLVAAIQRAGFAYNFMDLTILLMSQDAMNYLLSVLPASPERTNLLLFLDQYRVPDKNGNMMIDIKRMRDVFGGIGGRMYMFGTGSFGQVLNSYSPEVRLFESIKANKIIYAMLPTMGKDMAAKNFGKMLVGDYRTAISWVQALPEAERPWPPFIGFFDEAGSYVGPSWATMFEQARSAHTAMIPAVQTLANFEAVSMELKEMVIGNTWTKVFFKVGTQATATECADLIGMEKVHQASLSATDNQSSSSAQANINAQANAGEGSGMAVQEREAEEYSISPDDLKKLDKGEAIVTYGGSRKYHIRIPMLDFSAYKAGRVRINHTRPQIVRGLNLYRRADQYLGGDARKELEKN
jgi:hypothetical protein